MKLLGQIIARFSRTRRRSTVCFIFGAKRWFIQIDGLSPEEICNELRRQLKISSAFSVVGVIQHSYSPLIPPAFFGALKPGQTVDLQIVPLLPTSSLLDPIPDVPLDNVTHLTESQKLDLGLQVCNALHGHGFFRFSASDAQLQIIKAAQAAAAAFFARPYEYKRRFRCSLPANKFVGYALSPGREWFQLRDWAMESSFPWPTKRTTTTSRAGTSSAASTISPTPTSTCSPPLLPLNSDNETPVVGPSNGGQPSMSPTATFAAPTTSPIPQSSPTCGPQDPHSASHSPIAVGDATPSQAARPLPLSQHVNSNGPPAAGPSVRRDLGADEAFRTAMLQLYDLLDYASRATLLLIAAGLDVPVETFETLLDQKPPPPSSFGSNVFRMYRYVSRAEKASAEARSHTSTHTDGTAAGTAQSQQAHEAATGAGKSHAQQEALKGTAGGGCACGVHADLGLVTVSPRSTVPGMTLFDGASNSWVDVEHSARDNHLIVFTGETMGFLTNGHLRSPLHYVNDVYDPIERFSSPFFCRANPASLLHPLSPITYPALRPTSTNPDPSSQPTRLRRGSKVHHVDAPPRAGVSVKDFMEKHVFVDRPWRPPAPPEGVGASDY